MGFLDSIIEAMASGTVKKVQKPEIFDQGYTHHIVTFKTNTVYIDKVELGDKSLADGIMASLAPYGNEPWFNA